MEKPDIISENNKVVANCNDLVPVADIEKMILTIRGVQVMIDRDLAMLYGVSTSRLNEQVKRNIKRFPDDFMFQLAKEEFEIWKSQFATSNSIIMGARKRPYAFTANGIAMLSSVLRSETAVEVNIRIMRAFTATQRFFAANAQMFQRIEVIEYHQLELAAHQTTTDKKIEQILKRLDDDCNTPSQGIFYDGQIFDAYSFVSDLVRSAKESIVLFDNYVDDTVLTMLDKRRENVSATIFTKAVSAQLELDLAKHNAQYRPIEVKEFDKVHDRFLCINSTVVGVKDYFSFFTRFTVCLIFPIIKLSSSDDSVSDVSRSGITMSVSISPKCCILLVCTRLSVSLCNSTSSRLNVRTWANVSMIENVTAVARSLFNMVASI